MDCVINRYKKEIIIYSALDKGAHIIYLLTQHTTKKNGEKYYIICYCYKYNKLLYRKRVRSAPYMIHYHRQYGDSVKLENNDKLLIVYLTRIKIYTGDLKYIGYVNIKYAQYYKSHVLSHSIHSCDYQLGFVYSIIDVNNKFFNGDERYDIGPYKSVFPSNSIFNPADICLDITKSKYINKWIYNADSAFMLTIWSGTDCYNYKLNINEDTVNLLNVTTNIIYNKCFVCDTSEINVYSFKYGDDYTDLALTEFTKKKKHKYYNLADHVNWEKSTHLYTIMIGRDYIKSLVIGDKIISIKNIRSNEKKNNESKLYNAKTYDLKKLICQTSNCEYQEDLLTRKQFNVYCANNINCNGHKIHNKKCEYLFEQELMQSSEDVLIGITSSVKKHIVNLIAF